MRKVDVPKKSHHVGEKHSKSLRNEPKVEEYRYWPNCPISLKSLQKLALPIIHSTFKSINQRRIHHTIHDKKSCKHNWSQ
jgi:hypothetical protein